MSQPVAFVANSAGSASGGGGRPTLEPAVLELRKPPTDGSLEAEDMIEQIKFQFNPKELSVNKAAKWGHDTKSSNPLPQFMGPEPCKLALEMFLDASDTQDNRVVKTVEKLFSCCVPISDTDEQNKPNPPWVIFRWGSLSSFTGYIASVNVKYTLFTPDGLPIRATAIVNLQEISKELKGQNPTSGALSRHRVHTVRTGDTLASIAWREYRNPAMWRAIATVNHIDDPMRLRAGSSLLIPAAEDLHS